MSIRATPTDRPLRFHLVVSVPSQHERSDHEHAHDSTRRAHLTAR